MKTFSVRFPRELVDDIDEACETGDVDYRNSWMKQAVENELELEASIDEEESQDQEPKKEPQKITVEVSPEEEEGLKNGTWEIKQKPVEVENIRVSYDDGKTWHDTNTIS